MTDLVVHIGLSKCGSTTIQKSLSDLDGYLGRASRNKRANSLGKDFVRLSPRNPVRSTPASELLAWKAKVQDYAAEKGWTGNLVISNETLSSPKYGFDPLLKFLSALKSGIWLEGNVRVVIVLRQQYGKIPSEYAQQSDDVFNASQASFERYVERRCLEADLEYDRLVGQLHQILKAENVLVLFLEEIGTPGFWGTLYCFLGAEKSLLSNTENRSLTSNRKAISSGTWALIHPGSQLAARGFATKILLWTWPVQIFPKARMYGAVGLRAGYGLMCMARRLVEHKREDQISLSPALENKIRERFRDSNARLGCLVGRDLTKLGY